MIPAPRSAAVIATACLVAIITPFNSTSIVVALPEILVDLQAPLKFGVWIITAYLIAMAAVQPIGGALGDRYGRRRVLLTALALFLVASLIAAAATSTAVLILARTLQAVAGGSAMPNAMALLRDGLPVDQQGRAAGTVAVAIGVATAVGPPVGGWVADFVGWRVLFLLNVPLLLAAAVAVARFAPSSPPRPAFFDVRGAIWLALALAGMAGGASLVRVPDLPAAVAWGALGVGLIATLALVRRVRREPRSIVDMALLRVPAFRAACLSVSAANLAMYAAFFAVPLALQGPGTMDPQQVGWIVVTFTLSMLATGPLGGRLADRFGDGPPAAVGGVLAAGGLAALATVDPTVASPWLVAALAASGLGLGLMQAPQQAAAMRAATPERAGGAAGLFTSARYLGGITGTVLLARVLGDGSDAGAYPALYLTLAAAALLAAFAGTLLGRRPRQHDAGHRAHLVA